MGCYAIRHFEDGISGAQYLHRSKSGHYIFDYPSQVGNPSLNDLVRFEYLDECEAFLRDNLGEGMEGYGFAEWIE
jgi:hypothetical protein